MGATFNMNLAIANAQNAHTVQFQVTINPKLLKLVNVEDGKFLKSDSQVVALVQRVDQEGGTASISLTRPPDTGGLSGSGVLATLTFQAQGVGTAPVEVVRGSVRGPKQESTALPAAQVIVNIE